MNLKKILLISYKTFRHNVDRIALTLELVTIFILSFCLAIIVVLNALTSDLKANLKRNIELDKPFIIKMPADYKKFNISYIISAHEGLDASDINYLNGLVSNIGKLEVSNINIIYDLNDKNIYSIIKTSNSSTCYTREKKEQITIYDLSSGFNILGLPFKSLTLSCKWKKSSVNAIEVQANLWDKLYKNKIFSYKIILKNKIYDSKNREIIYEQLKQLEKQANGYSVINMYSSYHEQLSGLIFVKIVIDIVFFFLCLLLGTLLFMNSTLFIKNRTNDWKIFYLFQIKRKYTKLIIIIRFFFIFLVTTVSSLILSISILSILCSEYFNRFLQNNVDGWDEQHFDYSFTLNDILFVYGLLVALFVITTYITIKGLHKETPLNSKKYTGLKVNNLNASYSNSMDGNFKVLDNVSLDNEKLTAIIGVSGSGKTTLLNSIFNNKHLDKEVFVDIKHTLYIPQYPNLIEELTIRENLFLFNEEKDNHYLITEFKLNTILDHYPKQTSVGEKQRVCIIRALLSKPKILILDEPTASLDIENKIKVIELFNRLINNNTLDTALLVTHDQKVIELCNKVYLLENNKLILVNKP